MLRYAPYVMLWTMLACGPVACEQAAPSTRFTYIGIQKPAPTPSPSLSVGAFTFRADRPTATAAGGKVTMRATVFDLAGQPLTGATVMFGVAGGNASLSIASGSTDSGGGVLLSVGATSIGPTVVQATVGEVKRTARVRFLRACNGVQFAAANVVPAANTSALTLAQGDIDNDGDIDLVTEVDGGHVQILLNDGHGTFSSTASFAGDTAQAGDGLAATLADLDGDGLADVVTSLYGNASGSVGIYPNTGHGTLGTLRYLACGGDQRPTLADVDGDGSTDIAASSYYGDVAAVCLNNATPFVNPVIPGLVAGGYGGRVALADLNRDGRLDMVVGNSNGNLLSVLMRQSSGAWANVQPLDATTLAYYVATEDLNRDGAADIALCNYNDGAVRVLLNDGSGRFEPPVVYAGITSCDNVHAADFNGDAAPELVLTALGGTQVAVLQNAGDGTFAAPVPFDTGGQRPVDLVAEDFDNDGALDLAVVVNGGVSLLTNACP